MSKKTDQAFRPSDVLNEVDNEFEMNWDEQSREFLMAQFIADNCDPDEFLLYLEEQARAQLEEDQAYVDEEWEYSCDKE